MLSIHKQGRRFLSFSVMDEIFEPVVARSSSIGRSTSKITGPSKRPREQKLKLKRKPQAVQELMAELDDLVGLGKVKARTRSRSPKVPALDPFFGGGEPPTKMDCRKKLVALF